MTANLYDSDGVTITPNAVRGAGGAYELNSVTGIEPGLRLGWIIACLVAIPIFPVLGASAPRGSAVDWLTYGASCVCLVMIWMNFRYRPVFVRTATGLAPLATMQSSDARQKIVAAFLAAKQAPV